ncbi:hypothetical protein ACNQGP_06100 [Flavobacterium sp. GT2N3]|uniref:hypothetical protein n=1 Tax=unclassified Flavobacterium TaxID=196869 RepID=UPI003AAB9D53
MARIYIDKILVITYEHEKLREIYWQKLSSHIIQKHENSKFSKHEDVELILFDCFNFLVNEFKEIINSETLLPFFLYIFYLHEESIKLFVKISAGYSLNQISESEFARYRRILKLILEQGCDINLGWGKFPEGKEVFEMDEKLQKLLHIGTWIYEFADLIAYHKMINESREINFDENNLLQFSWQHHYGIAYKNLFPTLSEDYEKAVFDENAIEELKQAINQCFEIDYNIAGQIIFEIKKFHNATSPFQTIEPYVLPLNLKNHFPISDFLAESFYNGLSISRKNKMSLKDVVRKPYSTERYMYRPILIYNIEGVDRALVGREKFVESIYVLATNAINWNTIPNDWLRNKGMMKFISRKGNTHDKILEDKIEAILIQQNLLYSRNIKTFKQPNKINIRIDNELAGEIDYIVVNINLKTIFVADSKYNKARYEAVGYRSDYSNFFRTYEPQLERKVKWIEENKIVLQEHLKITNNLSTLEISDFDVVGVFFINTPSFYMFNGNYKAITLNQISNFVSGNYKLIELNYNQKKFSHPYFRKP